MFFRSSKKLLEGEEACTMKCKFKKKLLILCLKNGFFGNNNNTMILINLRCKKWKK